MKNNTYYSNLDKNRVVIYDITTSDTVEVVLDGNKLQKKTKNRQL